MDHLYELVAKIFPNVSIQEWRQAFDLYVHSLLDRAITTPETLVLGRWLFYGDVISCVHLLFKVSF